MFIAAASKSLAFFSLLYFFGSVTLKYFNMPSKSKASKSFFDILKKKEKNHICMITWLSTHEYNWVIINCIKNFVLKNTTTSYMLYWKDWFKTTHTQEHVTENNFHINFILCICVKETKWKFSGHYSTYKLC